MTDEALSQADLLSLESQMDSQVICLIKCELRARDKAITTSSDGALDLTMTNSNLKSSVIDYTRSSKQGLD